MVFDFGGNQADDEIMIESLVLKDHANDDGTVVPVELKVPFDYNTAGNLWKDVDENKSFANTNWFGDAGWAPIECTPVVKHEGNKHSIVIPVETPAEQWHAQWALTEVPVAIKMGQKVLLRYLLQPLSFVIQAMMIASCLLICILIYKVNMLSVTMMP